MPIDSIRDFHAQVEAHPSDYCQSIKKLVARQKRMLELYDYNTEIPEKICKWIEKWCIITEGERSGEHVKLTLVQRWIYYSIFGFYGNVDVAVFDEDGNMTGTEKRYMRVVNDVLYVVGSGNSKTTLLGWLNCYLLTHEIVPKCNIYIGSNAYKQSRLCFDTTLNVIKKNRKLLRCFDPRPSIGEIEETTTGAKVQAMSSKGDNQEGVIPAVIEIDEIHAMKTSDYADNLRKSTKRSDLLVVEMTTEGTVRGGYLDQRMDYAKRLLDGDVEQENYRFLPIIFEQDSVQEIFDAFHGKLPITTLRKSNPLLGTAVAVELLLEKIRDMIDRPSTRSSILTKNFNIPQNPTSSYYTEAECRTKPFNEAIFENAPVFIGLDMAYTRHPEDDLAAISIELYNPFTEERYFKDIAFLPKYWHRTEKDADGELQVFDDDMVRWKSKTDRAIPYNERTKRYGYNEYARRGDVVILNEKLRDELVSEFGEQAWFDLSGVTENFIIYYVAHLEMMYHWKILKFGLDPNKAGNIMGFAHSSIPSFDGKDPVVQFRIENPTHSAMVIAGSKESRSRGLVYCNSKLTELHFAGVTARDGANGGIVFTNSRYQRKDIVISELSADSARLVFLTNKHTGEHNMNALKGWWSENGDRIKNLQGQAVAENT